MKINVEHIAKLARLGITTEEKETFGRQLSAILEYAEILNKLNTDKIAPASHAIPMKNVLREDKVVPCKNSQDILINAPEKEDNMFKVPRIVE